MGREDYEVFKLLQQDRIQEGAERRAVSNNEFGAASQLATQSGMTLVRHSEVHYQLRGQAGWLLNIYPGNRRLYHDRNRPKPPYLKVDPNWTLIDIVRTAIAASNNTDSFAKEIAKRVVTDDQIQIRAYYLWEAAGCPGGDGKDFWFQAEKEMRGQ